MRDGRGSLPTMEWREKERAAAEESRKRCRSEHEEVGGPEVADGDGRPGSSGLGPGTHRMRGEDRDEEMGVPLATESEVREEAGGGRQKRSGEEMMGEEPASRKQRIEAIGESDTEFDVCELLSPPRVCRIASTRGFKAGYSLDIEHYDEITGQKWDLLQSRAQGRLWNLLKSKRSQLLVVSPPCQTISASQQHRCTEMDVAEKGQVRTLLKVGVQACQQQMKQGSFFVLEQPVVTNSWEMPEVMELQNAKGVYTLELDQYGLRCYGNHGNGCAKNATRLLTNMVSVAEMLGRRGCVGNRHLPHRQGCAKANGEYPLDLCQAMLDSLALEGQAKEESLMEMLNLDEAKVMDQEEVLNEELWWEWQGQRDDNTGEPLDPGKVKAGREKEIAQFQRRGVYERVRREEAMQVEGGSS